ncbi:MAG: endonuclease/exonuclease/phosphatase family protein [Armatimonadetes bacterium]|nr:endonuclease/exonuclease/phosphatase family protein [Armatimonadota bacterium]
MKAGRAGWVAIPLVLAVATFLFLQFRCSAEEPVPPKEGLRVATYNIEWLSQGTSLERIANLKSVIKRLDADVIALQEIESRKALQQVFDSQWELGIMDDPSERQELAIAVKKPLHIETVSLLFTDSSLDDAFPDARDVLRAVVSTPQGTDLVFYVVHFKSRSGGRRQTDYRRIMASSMLAAYLRGKNEPLAIVLGDFNDTPDDTSLNILETGNLQAKAGIENEKGPFLINLTEPLFADDYVSVNMHERFRGEPLRPVVKGAQRENERWRGKDYRYPQDLAMTQILFDQILVTPRMAGMAGAGAFVYARPDAMRGKEVRARRLSGGDVEYQDPGTLASDHLPVYADFMIESKR